MPIGQMFSVLGTVVDSDWCDGVATISEQQRLPLSFSSLTFFALSVPSDNPQPYEKSKISVDVGLGFQNAVQVKCVCVCCQATATAAAALLQTREMNGACGGRSQGLLPRLLLPGQNLDSARGQYVM